MVKKKIILLTGSTGFLGKSVLNELSKDYNVIQTLRDKKKINKNKNEIYFDLNDLKSYNSILKIKKIDYIIHLASRIGWSGEKLSDMFQANVLATGFLAQVASNHNAKIIFSSAALIHGTNKVKINPNTKLSLDNPYMETKYLAERLIKSSEVKYCILRIAGIFGLNGPNHLGINKTINQAIKKEMPNLGQNLQGKRNYIYVKDAAKLIKDVIKRDICGIHLMAGSNSNTIKDMVRKTYEVFYPESKIKFDKSKFKKSQIIKHSNKLQKTRSFIESLKDMKNSQNL